MSAPKPTSAGSPKQQLDSFLAKFTPEMASFARRALVQMRKRLPNAIEMVYDNYNALVVGFAPNERPEAEAETDHPVHIGEAAPSPPLLTHKESSL